MQWHAITAIECGQCNYLWLHNATSIHQHVWNAPSTKQTAVNIPNSVAAGVWNSSGVFREISRACILGLISLKYFRVDWKTWLETLITCFHWRIPCSELQVAWPGPKRPTHSTSEILAKALEAPEMTPFWWAFFSKMEKFHFVIPDCSVCFLCFFALRWFKMFHSDSRTELPKDNS